MIIHLLTRRGTVMYQLRLLLSNEEQKAYDEGFERGSSWCNSWRPGGPNTHRNNVQSYLKWLSWMEGFAVATNDTSLFRQLHGRYERITRCRPS